MSEQNAERQEILDKLIARLTEAKTNEKIEFFATVSETEANSLGFYTECSGKVLALAYAHLKMEHPRMAMATDVLMDLQDSEDEEACDCATCDISDCTARKAPFTAKVIK